VPDDLAQLYDGEIRWKIPYGRTEGGAEAAARGLGGGSANAMVDSFPHPDEVRVEYISLCFYTLIRSFSGGGTFDKDAEEYNRRLGARASREAARRSSFMSGFGNFPSTNVGVDGRAQRFFEYRSGIILARF
jgi:hypothetical protein